MSFKSDNDKVDATENISNDVDVFQKAASDVDLLQKAASDVDVIEILPAPPDGGYGWVIVFCAFICCFFVDGIAYSFAAFIPAYETEFRVTNVTV